MIEPRNSRRSGLIGTTVILSTLVAIQGCSLTGVPGSRLQTGRDPVLAHDAVNSSSDSSANIRIGAASWYGPGFNGKKTASGDIFDPTKLTAAHRSIPLGRRVRVTHLANGKSVEVLINDRGPYTEGRMIDLSQAAANALEMTGKGIAKVRVEELEEAVIAENVRNGNR
jgi:rare lipoprotein A (peptidoglycan hydrolase)